MFQSTYYSHSYKGHQDFILISSSETATPTLLANECVKSRGKKNRSDDQYPSYVQEACFTAGLPRSRAALQRSVLIAPVLLVLVFDGVCEWHDPLPG